MSTSPQEARGRRIGRQAPRRHAPSRAARRAGIWTLQAGVMAENAASLALHRSCGFRVVGVRERIGAAAWREWRHGADRRRRASLSSRHDRLRTDVSRLNGYAVPVRYQFVDCRWALGDPEWGRAQYLAGHIPGAVFLDLDQDLAAPAGTHGRHPLPDAADFARAAGGAGIGAGVFVIAYGGVGGAERLWWLLRHFGHDDCAVIDLDSWRGPLRSGAETADARHVRAPAPRRRHDRRRHAERRSSSRSLSSTRARPPVTAARTIPSTRIPGPDPRRPQRALGRATARAAGGRARRLLRLGRRRLRRPPSPPPRRARRPPLSRLLVGVGTARRSAPRARLGRSSWFWLRCVWLGEGVCGWLGLLCSWLRVFGYGRDQFERSCLEGAWLGGDMVRGCV